VVSVRVTAVGSIDRTAESLWYSSAMRPSALKEEVLVAQAREALRTGEAVRLRREAGLMPGDVAALAGVSRPTVVRWEAGQRSPSGAAARRYAHLLVRLGMKVRGLNS